MTEKVNLKVGSLVYIPGTKKSAEIIGGPNAKGEFQLALGEMKLWVLADRLFPVEGKDKKRAKPVFEGGSAHGPSGGLGGGNQGQPVRVDLHGMRVQEAILALEQALNQALLKNAGALEVIHGIGTGALKRAVMNYLTNSKHVSNIRSNELNPGSVIAYL